MIPVKFLPQKYREIQALIVWGANSNIKLDFKLRSRRIGELVLEKLPDKKYPKGYQTHSWLDARYRGHNIGLWMYSIAADFCQKFNINMYSSVRYSEDAVRVWKSKNLRCYYSVNEVTKNKKPRYLIKLKSGTKNYFNKRTTNITFKEFVFENGQW